ncbi:response regulator [bacterium]|nr:response regulator [bacterium]
MKIRVLLVDDEKDYISSLFKQLVVRNYDVTAVYNGDEAIKAVEKSSFDVIILDVLMPGKDGIETFQEIKKIDPSVQVIMHTGHAKLDLAIDGLKNGINDYVIKPVDIDELVEKIDLAYKGKVIKSERI